MCRDQVSWQSSTGHNCEDYFRAGNDWCRDGAAGLGWNASWGPFSTYEVAGVDAAAACCQCGPRLFQKPIHDFKAGLARLCRVRESEIAVLVPATSSTARSDREGYTNGDGSHSSASAVLAASLDHHEHELQPRMRLLRVDVRTAGDHVVSLHMGVTVPRSISQYAAAQLADSEKLINATGISSLQLSNVALTCGSGREPSADGECSLCTKGFYKSLADNTTCVQCPLYSTTSSVGSTQFEDCVCAAGYYVVQSDANSLNCSACPAGTFKAELVGSTAASDCGECPAGKFTNHKASTACERCIPGTYSTSLGAASNTSCLLCAKGTFSALGAGTTCVQCPAGKYADVLGATACAACRTECPDRRAIVSGCTVDADLSCAACCMLASWSLNGDTLDSSLNAVDLVNNGLTFEASSSAEPWTGMYARFDSSGLDYASVGPGFKIPLGDMTRNDGFYTDAQLTIETWVRSIDDEWTLFHYSEATGSNDLTLFGGASSSSRAKCELYAGRNFVVGPDTNLCSGYLFVSICLFICLSVCLPVCVCVCVLNRHTPIYTYRILDNAWHHFAITLKDNEVAFYLDGTYVGAPAQTLEYNLKVFGVSGYMVLGQDADGPGGNYDVNQANNMSFFYFILNYHVNQALGEGEKDQAQCDKRVRGWGEIIFLKDTALGSGFLTRALLRFFARLSWGVCVYYCSTYYKAVRVGGMADFGILSPLNSIPYTLNPKC